MNFLNPALLLGLALAALPIIIHLFTRAKSKTVKFSTLRFLHELQQKQIRRLKLRQLLLLLLRTLIIILLVLGFARPSLRHTNSAAAGANSAMAIILDTSYSMDAEAGLLPAAKDKAREIISMLQPGDQLFLLNSQDTTVLEQKRAFHHAEDARARLAQILTKNTHVDVAATLAFAQNLLTQSANVNKELYIISDFQQNAMPDSVDVLPDIRLFAIPIHPQKVRNLAVDHAEFLTTIIEKDKSLALQVQISNTGDVELNSSLVQVFVNDQRVAQTAIDLVAHTATTEVFHFNAEKSGFNSGYILLEDDAILRDNRFYFTFNVPEQLHVALFAEHPMDAQYLKLALDPQITLANLRVTDFAASRLRYTDFSQYDVLFLSGLSLVDAETSRRLLEYVENGGGLIIAFNSQADASHYNQNLLADFDLPQIVGRLGQPGQTVSYFSIDAVDFQHPIFSGVFENQSTEISRPLFFTAAEIVPDSRIRPIISFSNDAPFLFEKRMQQGTLLVFTSGFNRHDNDLPVRTLFAPLVTRCVTFCGAAHANDFAPLYVGSTLEKRLPFSDANESLEIFRPDGNYDRLSPQVRQAAVTMQYAQTDIPGIYQLEASGKILAQWAVNLQTDESQLIFVTDAEIAKSFKARLLSSQENLVDVITQQRFGVELWFYFILAAFLLLVAEMLLYRENKNV